MYNYSYTLCEHQSWWSNFPYATASTEPEQFHDNPVQLYCRNNSDVHSEINQHPLPHYLVTPR